MAIFWHDSEKEEEIEISTSTLTTHSDDQSILLVTIAIVIAITIIIVIFLTSNAAVSIDVGEQKFHAQIASSLADRHLHIYTSVLQAGSMPISIFARPPCLYGRRFDIVEQQ